MRSFFFDSSEAVMQRDPLRAWNQSVRHITFLNTVKDVAPAYRVLAALANETEFGGLLSRDASIFPVACAPPVLSSPVKQPNFHKLH